MTGSDTSVADERTAWVALGSVNGIGELWFAALVAAFGSASAVLRAAGRVVDDRALRRRLSIGRSPGLPLPVAQRVRDAAGDPHAAQRAIAAIGGWVLTPLDAAYPDRLRALDPMPPVLFGRGDASALSTDAAVAVVGTRRPTAAGRSLAARIGDRLAAAGAVVVSGLAIGIDGAAQAATVEAGGRTVGVIGGGPDQPGPRAHGRLVASLLEGGGAIVGEHPVGSRPTRGTFPRRNRVISGLADATLVIEAPHRSGALITARHALEQGRLLMAAPGRPLDPSVAGCLALLRETPARPIVGLDELVVDLGLDGGPSASTASRALDAQARSLDAPMALALLSPIERRVAERLAAGPATADTLIAATGLPPPVVASALTLLGLRGWTHGLGALHLPAGPLLRPGRSSAGVDLAPGAST